MLTKWDKNRPHTRNLSLYPSYRPQFTAFRNCSAFPLSFFLFISFFFFYFVSLRLSRDSFISLLFLYTRFFHIKFPLVLPLWFIFLLPLYLSFQSLSVLLFLSSFSFFLYQASAPRRPCLSIISRIYLNWSLTRCSHPVIPSHTDL